MGIVTAAALVLAFFIAVIAACLGIPAAEFGIKNIENKNSQSDETGLIITNAWEQVY